MPEIECVPATKEECWSLSYPVTVQDEEKVTVVQAATNEAKPAAAVEEVQTVNATVGKKPLRDSITRFL
jgi:hypothetical protein